jgi:hypothetical protein
MYSLPGATLLEHGQEHLSNEAVATLFARPIVC